jgi:hypothetical protein
LGYIRFIQVRSGKERKGNVRTGQVRAGQVNSGQVRSGQECYLFETTTKNDFANYEGSAKIKAVDSVMQNWCYIGAY